MVTERKENVLINIIVDRDSVCMGDDTEPHKKMIKVTYSLDPIVFIKRVIAQYDIPTIAGVGHIWDCLLNGKLIVSIKGNSIEFKPRVTVIDYQENNELFFQYNSAIR